MNPQDLFFYYFVFQENVCSDKYFLNIIEKPCCIRYLAVDVPIQLFKLFKFD